MARYAKFKEFQQVRLKQDRPTPSGLHYNFREVPRAVTTKDRGYIVDVHDVEGPGYEVEFFDADEEPLSLLPAQLAR